MGGSDEEAILNATGQQGTVVQVFDRPSLCVQQRLDSLDDGVAMSEEELEQFDVCRKRHMTTGHRRAPVRIEKLYRERAGEESIDEKFGPCDGTDRTGAVAPSTASARVRE
jgi:hypothetical protein